MIAQESGAAGAADRGRGTLAGVADEASQESPGEPRWQTLLADAVRSVDELWTLLELPPEALPGARSAAAGFPLLAPRGYLALAVRGDPHDPILRQVLPLDEELIPVAGYGTDPLAEGHCSPAPGLLHKYRSRALLVATGACAVHCRYCFRRHYPYQEVPRAGRWWNQALAHVAADSTIAELLLSGGDPLTLPDAMLSALIADAAAIPHLRRIRVHTRLPVVLPERTTPGLVQALTGTRLQAVMVIHANHAREISEPVEQGIARLRAAGITVLNQSVLLRGVNDTVGALVELSSALIAAGVLPYYLHLLDRVAGAHHFDVDEATAIRVHQALAAALPGYLVPRLVREQAGAPGKTVIRG